MGHWSFVVASLRKDLVRRARDPFALLLWIGIPVVICGLLVLAMGGSSGPAPKAKVFVVDNDDSFLSRMLLQALSSERVGLIEVEQLDEATARARIRDGQASALLVVPERFGQAVMQEEPCRLELVTNPAQRILPGIVENALSILCEGSFYLHRVLGDELGNLARNASSGSLEDLRVAEASVRIRHDVERVSEYLFPPSITVETVVRNEGGAERSSIPLGAYFVPSTLLMALLFMAEGMADDLWRERVLGVLRRITVAPQGVAAALVGKLLAGAILMFGVSLAGLALAALSFDLELARVVPAALWAGFSGAVLLALMTMLKLFAGSQRSAGFVGNLVMFPLILIGGSLIPFEAMPAWLARIGSWTPNGWSMNVLKEIVFGAPDPARLALSFVALLALGACFCAVSVARLRSFARGA